MESSSGVPEVPLGSDHRHWYGLAGGDAELAAIALLCLVFAWPVDEPAPRPRSVS